MAGVMVLLVGLVLAGLQLALFWWLHRRLTAAEARQTAAMIRRAERDYEQVEALLGLYAVLPVRTPLPPMRKWAISPDFARLLVETIRNERPQTVVELGAGTSTVINGYALEVLGRGGQIVSLEHLAPFAERSRSLLAEHGLDQIATVIHAPLVAVTVNGETWRWYNPAALVELPDSIDLLVVDAPPQAGNPQPMARYPALPLMLERLSDRAVILVDDAARDDEQAMLKRWLAEFDGFVLTEIETEKGAAILKRRTG